MAQEDPFFESEGLLDYYTERRREYQETYREEGRTEGRKEGRERGHREALRGMAERRFGAEVAERLTPALAGFGTEYMPTVGDWIIDCATGEELIARVERLQ